MVQHYYGMELVYILILMTLKNKLYKIKDLFLKKMVNGYQKIFVFIKPNLII